MVANDDGAAETFSFPTVKAVASAAQDGTVEVDGQGWLPAETVRLSLGDRRWTAAADVQGSFHLRLATGGRAADLPLLMAGGIRWDTVVRIQLPSTTSITTYNCGGPYGTLDRFQISVSGLRGTPTGTVSLENGGSTLTSATLSNGQATLNISPTPGSYSMVVQYSGDYLDQASAASPVNCPVSKGTPGIVAFTNGPSGAIYGQPVQIEASVFANVDPTNFFGNVYPTGQVQFFSNGVSLGTATIPATISVPLPIGQNVLSAKYLGDANFGSAASTNVSSVTVIQAATTSTVTVTPSPAFYDAPVSVQYGAAVYAPSQAVVQGSCTLTLDAASIGCTTLDANGGGSKSFPSGLSVGTHTLVFTYFSTTNFVGSTQTATLLVQKDTPTLFLASSLNPSIAGHAVTWTAVVSPSNPATVTGAVSFSDGSTLLGKVNVNTTGIASLATSALSPGSHTITAVYSGDGNFNASSASLTQTVNSQHAPCDVNGDGAINATDVQRIVNEASGVAQAVDDLNGDGRLTVTDIQVEINAVLNRGCAAQ